jgi:hypothetical protein
MSQQSSLTQSAHSVRQVLTAYSVRCHAFKSSRQKECVQMPVKIARSAPRPSFGLPELLVAIQPRVSLAARPENREYLRQFGSHPGNPG